MTALLHIPRLDCEVELDGRLTVLRGEDALMAKSGHLVCHDWEIFAYRLDNDEPVPLIADDEAQAERLLETALAEAEAERVVSLALDRGYFELLRP